MNSALHTQLKNDLLACGIRMWHQPAPDDSPLGLTEDDGTPSIQEVTPLHLVEKYPFLEAQNHGAVVENVKALLRELGVEVVFARRKPGMRRYLCLGVVDNGDALDMARTVAAAFSTSSYYLEFWGNSEWLDMYGGFETVFVRAAKPSPRRQAARLARELSAVIPEAPERKRGRL
jgi:hypothetical protein